MDLSIFVGAFLGFLAGIALDRLTGWWGRRERRTLWRNLILSELVRNLTSMARMDESTRATRAAGYVAARTIINKPRAATLRSVATTSDALLSLPSKEQMNVVELTARLDRLLDEYASWPDSLGGQAGALLLQNSDGSAIPAREVRTRQLLETITDVRLIHMSTLVQIVNSSPSRSLTQPLLRTIRQALQPTRRRWWRRKPRSVTAIETSSLRQIDEKHTRNPLVVWVHDEPNYPAPVIELKTIIAGWRKEQP